MERFYKPPSRLLGVLQSGAFFWSVFSAVVISLCILMIRAS